MGTSKVSDSSKPKSKVTRTTIELEKEKTAMYDKGVWSRYKVWNDKIFFFIYFMYSWVIKFLYMVLALCMYWYRLKHPLGVWNRLIQFNLYYFLQEKLINFRPNQFSNSFLEQMKFENWGHPFRGAFPKSSVYWLTWLDPFSCMVLTMQLANVVSYSAFGKLRKSLRKTHVGFV